MFTVLCNKNQKSTRVSWGSVDEVPVLIFRMCPKKWIRYSKKYSTVLCLVFLSFAGYHDREEKLINVLFTGRAKKRSLF